MANKIRKTIDTPIAKIAISVSDKKYLSSINLWKDRVTDSVYDRLNGLPKTIEEGILAFIPRIKSIRYEDFRNDEFKKSYKCILEFTAENSSPSLLNPNSEYDTRTYVDLTDATYVGIRIDKLSEDELKMYSLSFALETMAVIPTYISGIITGSGRTRDLSFMETFRSVLNLCFPDYYKKIVKMDEVRYENKIYSHIESGLSDDGSATKELMDKALTLSTEAVKRKDEAMKIIERDKKELKKLENASLVWLFVSYFHGAMFFVFGIDASLLHINQNPILYSFLALIIWIFSANTKRDLDLKAIDLKHTINRMVDATRDQALEDCKQSLEYLVQCEKE